MGDKTMGRGKYPIIFFDHIPEVLKNLAISILVARLVFGIIIAINLCLK
jgi:hypothetical protein